MKTMVLVIDELEYEALDNAVRFVLETTGEDLDLSDPFDKDYSMLLENTERVLDKLEMLKKVYN
jgi:hypothetical protein